jgi:hypothetical protein
MFVSPNIVQAEQLLKSSRFINTKTKLRGVSPQANYTDRATAACRRSQCQLLRIVCVARSAQRIPTAVNLGSLDPESQLFHSSSSSVILTRLSGPRSRPTTCFMNTKYYNTMKSFIFSNVRDTVVKYIKIYTCVRWFH